MIKLKHVPIYDRTWFKYWLRLNRIRKLDIAQARWRWCLRSFCSKHAVFCYWLQFFHEPLSTVAVLAELRSVLEALSFRQVSWLNFRRFGEWWAHISSYFCVLKAVSDRLHANGSLSAGSPRPWLLWAMCHPLFTTELSCCNVLRTHHPTAVQLHSVREFHWISIGCCSIFHLCWRRAGFQGTSCKDVRFVPENPRPELSSLDARTYAWNAQAWTCVSGNAYQSIAKKNHWKFHQLP